MNGSLHTQQFARAESRDFQSAAAAMQLRNRRSGFYLRDNRPQYVVQKKSTGQDPVTHKGVPIQRKANSTGLPDQLKSGIENLSGYSLDDVKVHYHSSKPAQLHAHAYAQGNEIHIASGQEKHLPHEAWHVVQQKQGRVKPTVQLKGKYINDNTALEKEADVMGTKAIHPAADVVSQPVLPAKKSVAGNTVQRQGWIGWGLGGLAGAAGAVAGGLAGTVTGAVAGYRDGGGIMAGAQQGFWQGGEEGWQAPVAKAGEIAGGIVGGSAGVAGAVAGGLAGTVTGAVGGYRDGGGIITGAAHGRMGGAEEGWHKPAAKAGEITGGVLGNVIGAGGALSDRITGSKKMRNAARRAGGLHIEGEGFVPAFKNGVLGGWSDGYDHPLAAGGIAAGATAGILTAGAASAWTAGAMLAGGAGGEFLDQKIKKPKLPKTNVTHTTGKVNVAGVDNKLATTQHPVGKKMTARLSASDPVKGSATDVNWTWMQALRLQHPNANIVRGHLLNHDLGGFGVPENLYPISTLANHYHSALVEQPVKQLLVDQLRSSTPKMVNYTVEVVETVKDDPTDAAFKCRYYVEGKAPKTRLIESHLGKDKGGFGGKSDNPLDQIRGNQWHHGDRKGDEMGFAIHTANGMIRTKKPKLPSLSDNIPAAYSKGAGAQAVNLEAIFDTLNGRFFNGWDPDVKYAVTGRSRDDFGTIIRKIVEKSTSYKDNYGDPVSLMQLISQVIEEQLENVKAQVDISATLEEAKALKNYELWNPVARVHRSHNTY